MGTGRELDATLLSTNTTVSEESAVGLEGEEGEGEVNSREDSGGWILKKMVEDGKWAKKRWRPERQRELQLLLMY